MTPGQFAIIAAMVVLPPLAASARAADGAAPGAEQRAEQRAAAQNRIVFQINEDDSRKWNTVLTNINNVQEELGRVEVAVVVIGPALGMLKAEALTANRVRDAMSAGVRFVACGNSMTALKLSKDDMLDGIDHARAGYVEIMRLQRQGYAYIRP